MGAGMAGPVLAIALKRVGFDPVIYESRAEPRNEVGAFLGLAPNGCGVLRSLGVLERVSPVGVRTDGLAFLNHKGRELGANPQSVFTFKRGLLARGLREAAISEGIPLKWGKRLVGVSQESDSVAATFEDGSEISGDLLIGCDGVHSRTRRLIFPNAPSPKYTGIVGSGSYARPRNIESTKGRMLMTFGLRGFFGYQALDSGEVYWFNNLHQPEEPDQQGLDAIPEERWRERLLETHSADHAPIQDIIYATERPITRYGVYEMPVLSDWHRGRVCLVGDSAHAMGPHTGQGASMAFEDALVLAKCLRDIDDPERAFATYQEIRKERVDFVVRATRQTGNSKKPPGLLGRRIRDFVLPIFLKKGVKAFDPIYAHRIDPDERITFANFTKGALA